MLWIKAFHIVFIASWFAALLYLPRIFVNLAQETNAASVERLLLMARKLYRFSLMLSVPAVLLGLGLWLGWREIFQGGWLHAKIALVVLAIGYNHACGSLLKKFENNANNRYQALRPGPRVQRIGRAAAGQARTAAPGPPAG